MNHVLTIAKRELTSLFFSPVAYVVLGLFGFGASFLFLNQFGPGVHAQMRGLFWSVLWLMVLLVPAISMRLLSEEFRAGTIEPLMTSPVSDAQVVLGKWLGALGFFLALLVPLCVLVVVLEFNADPDMGPILVGLLGLLMVGALYLAIGTFASAITQNQIIAFLVTCFIILLFSPLTNLVTNAKWLADYPGIREGIFHVNVFGQFEDFSKGIVDLSRVVFFLSGTGLFLFLATMTLQSRRWR